MQLRGGPADGPDSRHGRLAAAGAPAFDYPPRPVDRLLGPASRVERAIRGLLRAAAGRSGAAGWRELVATAGSRGHDRIPAPGGAPVVLLPAVAWSYRFQRPQRLALALAGAAAPVLYCESFRRTRLLPRAELDAVSPGVWRLQLALRGRPDPYRSRLGGEAAGELARRIAGGLRERPRVLVAQLPFWAGTAAALADALRAPLVYDLVDLHRGFSGVPAAVEAAEDALLARADLVTATSEVLLERARGTRAPSALLPNAVDLDCFPDRPRRFGPPVRVGYVGALADWFDAGEVARLAAARPAWRLVLAGRVEDARVAALRALPNVELRGEIPHRDVPAFLQGLNALLVPFLDLPLTRAVDPVKLYEGLAAGLPVVSRALPALARWPEPLVYTAHDGSLLEPLERALAEDGPAPARLRRRAVAAETWRARADTLLALVDALDARPAVV